MRERREGHAKSEHANVASYALRVTLSIQTAYQIIHTQTAVLGKIGRASCRERV